MRATTTRQRAVRAVAAGALALVLTACALPPGGGTGSIDLLLLSNDPVPLVKTTEGGFYEGDARIRVTNNTPADFAASDVSVTQEGFNGGFSVGLGSCFTDGVVTGGTCEVIPHLQAPAGEPDQSADSFAVTVHLGDRSESIDLTALLIEQIP